MLKNRQFPIYRLTRQVEHYGLRLSHGVGSHSEFCQVDLRPLYARTFHFRLIAATPLQLHRIRAAISEIVISVSESNNTIRRISSSLKDRPCTAIVSPNREL
jgi:hypothetical protein